jgi:serine/threonine protein kinase
VFCRLWWEKFLGKGAFAEVYRVMQSLMNVPRAIKVLRKDTRGAGSDDYRKAMERFKIEVQLGSQLDHPNVIKVYDCEEKAGELFLIMECADGGSLKDRLDRGELLSVEEATRLGADICNGLKALHEKLEAIHRDIKPSNILFAADGTAKIGDLGLAQVSGLDSLRSELGTSFSPGHPGTPEYMSPEQETTKGYLLPTSDIFSMGCVLFEALTGKRYEKVYGTRLRDHRADIPVWLEDIVARALAETQGSVPDDDRDPKKRFRQADIMRRALERGWQEELHRREEEQKHREAEERAIQDAEERGHRPRSCQGYVIKMECARSNPGGHTRIPAWLGSILTSIHVELAFSTPTRGKQHGLRHNPWHSSINGKTNPTEK